MKDYQCYGCSQEFNDIDSYLSHTKECKELKQMHEDFEYQTHYSLLTPKWADDYFKPTGVDLDLIGAFIRVIKEIRFKKFNCCHHYGREYHCPEDCPYWEQSICETSCKEPCGLQFIIENLCDIAHDLVNEEMKK
jgi:hypothetical protein